MADIKTLVASAPEKIFLVIGEGCPADGRFDLLEEVTWCQDDIDGNGIAYIKAEAHQAEVARLTRENEWLAADLVSIRSAWNVAEEEFAGLAKDAARLDWLEQSPHSGFRIEYEGQHVGYSISSWDDVLLGGGYTIREAFDHCRAALAGASGAAHG